MSEDSESEDDALQQDNTNSEKEIDYVPMTLLLVNSVKGKRANRPFLCVLDTGASNSWFKQSSLPSGIALEE